MPYSSAVSLNIYNLSGQLIKTILSQKLLQAGSSILKWDGRNESGNVVCSGIYFYRINSGNFTKTGKMMLIK
ncbi:MAG: T9SS type A sorting domain-containing protein [bacterium]|nr:T9SS type A sorting domain-containing protein [bacterium]